MAPIYLQSYGCTTAAGTGTEVFFKALQAGKSLVIQGTCRIPRTFVSAQEHCVQWLLEANASKPKNSDRLGVILASTKGCIEDWISEYPKGGWEGISDPLTPVLESFIKAAGLKVHRSVCVSTACTSSHSAVYLAQCWLRSGACDRVLVCAVDYLGDFIEKGFRSLQAVCRNHPMPFAADRDGLGLGEGAAVLEFGLEPSVFELDSVAICTEGVSLTRPSALGAGLKEAITRVLPQGKIPSLVIAHGTGTKFNETTEDEVFSQLLPETPVTCVKWCVGHTMGVSGALDLIAACESIRRQSTFRVATVRERDPGLKSKVLTNGNSFEPFSLALSLDRIVISSLGFGGMNAAMGIQGRFLS